jgi:hypothetical protein
MYSAAKVILSGSIAEFYFYNQPVEYGYEQPKVQKSTIKEKTDEEKQETRKRSLLQTRRSLRNILQSNAWQFSDNQGRPFLPLFVTFTFRENVADLSAAHREFKYFVQRFNYRFYGKNACTKYLAVPEFQKRGAVHYHVVFLNLPFIHNIYDEISEIWGHGFTLVETIKNLRHLINYIAKYITADGLDERLAGRKRYFASRGLKKPLEIRDEEIIKNFVKLLPQQAVVCHTTFGSTDGREVEYVNYDIGQGKEIKKLLNL